MQTFGRLLSVLTFLLSLGFLAQALPAAPRAGLAVRQYNSPAPQSPGAGYTKPGSGNGSGDMSPVPSNEGKTVDVIALMTDLKANVDGHLKLMAGVDTVVDLDIKIKALVTDIKAMIAIMVGAKVHLNDDAKLKLAIAVHAMIIAIVKVCATVVAKLGVSACAAIMASLDVTIHSLLLTLNVVVNGFLGVLIGLFVNVDATVAAAIKTCGLSLLAKVLLGLNVTIN